jgi:pimeloyl-ACP methyl ester carboxylesterase
MPTINSNDGTSIAYDKTGQGPPVVLVAGATMSRSGFTQLAGILSTKFTVYNYDRRGRGDSTDTKPYSLEREIEDIEAIIYTAGGNTNLYGISSGACLAMHAAAVLGDKVNKLVMYEPPYDESEGAAATWIKYRSDLSRAIDSNDMDEAIGLFLKLVGVPEAMISGMKKSPMWPQLTAVAPTLQYDAAAKSGKTVRFPLKLPETSKLKH